jgi:predicted transcriptional regulator
LLADAKVTQAQLMTATDIKTDIVPCLLPDDRILKALQIMEEYRVVQVPVVKHGKYIGLITEDDALTIDDLEDRIAQHEHSLIRVFVLHGQHVFDIIKLIAEFRLSLVAVTDENQNYLGCITTESLVHEIAKFASVSDPGSIIVLDININDYSMTEVARIVESNDAKILSSFVTSHRDSTRMELTLKINKSDLSGIIQTFNRFNYTVSASYHESKLDKLIHDRYEELMKYLNM